MWWPKIANVRLSDLSNDRLRSVGQLFSAWPVKPSGTEGYRTAEVTLGGVDTRALSSKTMECVEHPGLYFIGEVIDVTGQLGGFNFQWAWALVRPQGALFEQCVGVFAVGSRLHRT